VFCGGGDGGTPPELCSAAGEVAGVAKPAFQGAIRDRVWAVEHRGCMRNPLEWITRGCGVRRGAHGVEAARRGGTPPAGASSCRAGGPRAKIASAGGRGGCCVAHRGLNRGMVWRRVSAA